MVNEPREDEPQLDSQKLRRYKNLNKHKGNQVVEICSQMLLKPAVTYKNLLKYHYCLPAGLATHLEVKLTIYGRLLYTFYSQMGVEKGFFHYWTILKKIEDFFGFNVGLK